LAQGLAQGISVVLKLLRFEVVSFNQSCKQTLPAWSSKWVCKIAVKV
jgi:hypothetical protein